MANKKSPPEATRNKLLIWPLLLLLLLLSYFIYFSDNASSFIFPTTLQSIISGHAVATGTSPCSVASFVILAPCIHVGNK